MAHSYKKAIAYTLMTAGPVLGVSNIGSVLYKTFYASASLIQMPSIYQTSTGNFLIGFTAMGLVLTGRNLLNGRFDWMLGETKQDTSYEATA
jgi:hypothetical protein